jgi:hypothetical protein
MLHLAQVAIFSPRSAAYIQALNPQPPSCTPASSCRWSRSRANHQRLVCYEMPEAGILTPEQDTFCHHPRRVIAGTAPALSAPAA